MTRFQNFNLRTTDRIYFCNLYLTAKAFPGVKLLREDFQTHRENLFCHQLYYCVRMEFSCLLF